MNDEIGVKKIINNQYDYSNIIPMLDAVSYLVEYCDKTNNLFSELTDKDEEKNKQYKIEYREYQYKKDYGQQFSVAIYDKDYKCIRCKDFDSFMVAVRDGNLNNVSLLEINLYLGFYSGKGDNLEMHNNKFEIIFKPYATSFTRTADHDDNIMNKIESEIIDILNQFPSANSIFCNKNS
jgi:hypothetical protein